MGQIQLLKLILADVILTGLTGVIVTPSVGTYNSISGIWYIPCLANGNSATLNITGTAILRTTINNTGNITGQQEFNSQKNIITTKIYIPAVDIRVKNLPWQYYPSTNTYEDTYSITNTPVMMVSLRNLGPDDATNVKIEFSLGNSFVFTGFETRGVGTASYNSNTKTVTWDVGDLPNGSGAALLVYFNVVSSGNKTENQTTIARLTHVDQNDTNSVNDVASYAIYVPKAADIQVSQSYETFSNATGSYVNYFVNVKNNGPDNVSGLQVTDKLPAGLIYDKCMVSNDGGITWTETTLYNSTSGIWNIGNFNFGDPAKIIKITAKITATSGTITNYASRTAINEFDCSPNNNAQTTYLNISGLYYKRVDIRVKNLPWQYYPSTNTYEDTYSITNTPVMMVSLRNLGPDDATNVKIEFSLGNSFVFTGFETRGVGTASYNSNTKTVTWDVGDLPNGSGAALLVYFNVVSSGNKTENQTTIARLTHVDQNDTNSVNDVASYAIYVPKAADIQVSQSYETFSNATGSYVNYFVNVKNNGPDNVSGLQVTDKLPAGLIYDKCMVSNDGGITWTETTLYNSTSGIWNIGNFNFGDPAKIIKITAKITATSGTITNYASRTAINEFDCSPNNNAQTTVLII